MSLEAMKLAALRDDAVNDAPRSESLAACGCATFPLSARFQRPDWISEACRDGTIIEAMRTYFAESRLQHQLTCDGMGHESPVDDAATPRNDRALYDWGLVSCAHGFPTAVLGEDPTLWEDVHWANSRVTGETVTERSSKYRAELLRRGWPPDAADDRCALVRKLMLDVQSVAEEENYWLGRDELDQLADEDFEFDCEPIATGTR